MNPLSLLTSAGVEKFRQDRTLGPEARRVPINNLEEASQQLAQVMDAQLPRLDDSRADLAPGKGQIGLLAPGQKIFITYSGDSARGSYTQQTVASGRGLGFDHTEFSESSVDSLQVGPRGARMLHVDRKDPGSSYAEVLGQPWNIFGSPASSPASPASVPPEAWVTTPSGLKYAVLQEGAGEEARPGQPALVDYTGWLADGTRFDSSLERKQPFEFLLGAGQVVRGWEEGVSGMKVGEKRKLLIPPELGYGNRGIGKIPPGATLEFEVTLLATRPAEQAAPE